MRSAHVLFINEFECGQVLQREVAAEKEAMVKAASDLLGFAGDDAIVVLHAANGAVVTDQKAGWKPWERPCLRT